MPPPWVCFSVDKPKLLSFCSCQAFWVSCTSLSSHLHLLCSQCSTHSASSHLFPPFQTVLLRDVVSDPILFPLGLCIPLRSSTYFWFTWCRKWSGHSPLLDSMCGHQRTKGRCYSERGNSLCGSGWQGLCLCGRTVFVCIQLLPSPSSNQLWGLQSRGKCHACLRPALTLIQLCDDIGRCHVWV